jgi:RNA methyltransferase, RsmD family
MRVTSGRFKGLKLIPPDNTEIRPTLDRVKQSVFNVIQFKVAGAAVLDLFSGSGALGIECVSRGSREVIFNDCSLQACGLIRENCARAGFIPTLYNSNSINIIERLYDGNKKFDIIFLDPPYGSPSGIIAIDFITKNGLLRENGVIVYEHTDEKEYVITEENYIIKIKIRDCFGGFLYIKNKY